MEKCDTQSDHGVIVDQVRDSFLEEESIYELADFFKILGDPTRVKILFALSKGELCVYHISQVVGMSQSSISHQLRILRQGKLVKSRKEGKMVMYSLDDQHIENVFQQGFEHIQEGRK